MKITCEYNNISYTFNTSKGQILGDKYKFLLSKLEKEKMDNGEMDYFTLEVKAISQNLELTFEFQGIALSLELEDQIEEVQDYIEDNLIFSKIEERFKQALSESQLPMWAQTLTSKK